MSLIHMRVIKDYVYAYEVMKMIKIGVVVLQYKKKKCTFLKFKLINNNINNSNIILQLEIAASHKDYT